MEKNITWNALVFVIIITTILTWLVWVIWAYTYSIYYRIIDMKSRIYLDLVWDSLKDKFFIDYLTDPINNYIQYGDYYGKYNINLNVNKIVKLVDKIEDRIIPWKLWMFFLFDFDLETKKELNKISQMMIYYKKSNESSTGSLNMTFVRYSKINPNIFDTWKVELSLSWCTQNTNSGLSEYKCQFLLQDFWDVFKANEYNYLLFFSSDYGVSYLIQALDAWGKTLKLPSRYLEQDFEVSSYSSKISNTVSSKIDLYDRFYLNLNKSLYFIK